MKCISSTRQQHEPLIKQLPPQPYPGNWPSTAVSLPLIAAYLRHHYHHFLLAQVQPAALTSTYCVCRSRPPSSASSAGLHIAISGSPQSPPLQAFCILCTASCLQLISTAIVREELGKHQIPTFKVALKTLLTPTCGSLSMIDAGSMVR